MDKWVNRSKGWMGGMMQGSMEASREGKKEERKEGSKEGGMEGRKAEKENIKIIVVLHFTFLMCSMNSFLSPVYLQDEGPFRCLLASTLSSLRDDKQRENTDSPGLGKKRIYD